VEEDKHGEECDEAAEPMMGRVEAAKQNEAYCQGRRQSDQAAVQDLSSGQRHQQNAGDGETHHQGVRNPQQQAEMPEEKSIDQVGAWGYELKVVAVGHLPGDDSGSVACEEHLIGPEHNRGVGQDKIAKETGGEGEGENDRE
jgi:hypothetical protein